VYLLLALISPAPAVAQPSPSAIADPLAMPPDFPPADQRIWALQQKGLTAKLAAQALAREPDAPETLDLLSRARRFDDAIAVFQRIVDRQPASLERALAFVPALVVDATMNAVTGRADTLRGIVERAKASLPNLPREDAARAARALLGIDNNLTRRDRGAWSKQLRAFVEEWAGTEAAVLANIDLITAESLTPAALDALDTFAREHPRTAVAAKALFQRGSNLAHNAMQLGVERVGSDPLKRFLIVNEIVRELESGRYPKCEWVDRAPELLFHFFSYKPAYDEGSVAKMLAVYEEYAKTHFTLDDRGLEWGLGYILSRKMRELYAHSGDGVAGVERLLGELERTSTNGPAVRYMRALFYIQLRNESAGAERAAFAAKARTVLLALRDEGAGIHPRKALATVAVLDQEEGSNGDAARHLTQYLQSYPSSPWAWVAALRLGKAYESMSDWSAASKAHLDAAARYASPAPARTLGHAYGARAYEALGRFSAALAQHGQALASWDDDFGPAYSLYFTRPSRPDEPFTVIKDDGEVAKSALEARTALLKEALNAPGGGLVETARWHFARGETDDAIKTLDRLLKQYPQSPIAAEGRVLSHRAQLARALDRRDRQELERLEREPYDFWVSAASIARAAMLRREGAAADADSLMMKALSHWHAHQAAGMTTAPPTDLEKDVIELRDLVFRPKGDGLFAGSHWELNSLAPSPTPFFVVQPNLRVTLSTGAITTVSVQRPIPGFDNVLFLNAEQLAFFDSLLAKIGGTERRQPGAIMEVPNQPVGGSQEILKLLQKFFPARAGHWGGWMFETFPMITQIEFANTERTKVGVRVTIGYEGATVIFEKKDGVWVYKEMTNRWIT
jgi:tetratricopeptide (TPR) repeat protein